MSKKKLERKNNLTKAVGLCNLISFLKQLSKIHNYSHTICFIVSLNIFSFLPVYDYRFVSNYNLINDGDHKHQRAHIARTSLQLNLYILQ